jgi:hypothetical protein
MELEELNKLEHLKESPKVRLKERRMELLRALRKGQQRERQRERQKEWAQRWLTVVEGCNVVAAVGVVYRDGAGEDETLMALRQRWCWCCHQHRSKPHSVRSSPIASSKSQERIGIPCFHHRFR